MAIKRLTVQNTTAEAKVDAMIETLKAKGTITAAEADNAKKGKK